MGVKGGTGVVAQMGGLEIRGLHDMGLCRYAACEHVASIVQCVSIHTGVPGCSVGVPAVQRVTDGSVRAQHSSLWELAGGGSLWEPVCCHSNTLFDSPVVAQLCPCWQGPCGTYQKRVMRPHIIEGNKYSSKKPADTSRWITTDVHLQDTSTCMQDGRVVTIYGERVSLKIKRMEG